MVNDTACQKQEAPNQKVSKTNLLFFTKNIVPFINLTY